MLCMFYCIIVLNPCLRVTRGDCATLTMLEGKLGLRVLRPFRLKCTLTLHNAQHRVVYIKTHSENAHQYGAFKIFLMMTAGETGQPRTPLNKLSL